MSFRRKLVQVMGAAVIGLVGAFAVVEPAAAVSVCPYPYVCFYSGYPNDGGAITGKYQVVTSYYQTISGTSMRAAYIQNTRHDDIAYVRFTDGKVICISPGSYYATDNDISVRQINGVMISWASSCY